MFAIIRGNEFNGIEVYTRKTFVHQGQPFGVFAETFDEGKMYNSEARARSACKKLNEKTGSGCEVIVVDEY